MVINEEVDFKGKEVIGWMTYSVKIYTLYHEIERWKMKLNKKKEHLWEVPKIKKNEGCGTGIVRTTRSDSLHNLCLWRGDIQRKSCFHLF